MKKARNRQQPVTEQESNHGAQSAQQQMESVMSNANLINVSDEISPEQCFRSLERQRKALKPQEVRRPKLEIASVIALVLGAWPRIQALREEMAKLPDLDKPAIDQLEQRVAALMHAQLQYLTHSESPDALRELAEEAVRSCGLLYADAQALASRGLINPNSYDDYSGGAGYKVQATDLQILVTVLKSNWSRIQGKCAVELAELDRAEKVAARILRLVGTRMQSDSAGDPALEDRDRAYTLVDQAYDEATRAIEYIRWPYGDAEQIAPSLYTTRKRRQSEPEEPATPPADPTAAQPNTGTTPVIRNLNDNPGGSPFMD